MDFHFIHTDYMDYMDFFIDTDYMDYMESCAAILIILIIRVQ